MRFFFVSESMPDQVELITTLAWGLGLSLIFGYLVSLIRMPALVGYLLAGVFLAPTTPGIVGNLDLASQLSEVGVILLMFGVGLHFSLRDLLQVREVAIPGAIFQMAATTIVGTLAAYFVWDWTFVGSLVIGVALSCASTVVMTKALDARGILQTVRGRLAVGWLVVQDLVTVLVLVAIIGQTAHAVAIGNHVVVVLQHKECSDLVFVCVKIGTAACGDSLCLVKQNDTVGNILIQNGCFRIGNLIFCRKDVVTVTLTRRNLGFLEF